MRFKIITMVLMASVLAACSTDDEEVYVANEVELLYNLASDMMERGNYKFSAIYFDEVERQHPYSPWARRAMLMSAYSYYKTSDYDEAVLSAQRFLTLHPGNKSAPYAHYLIANSYYAQISDVGRDQRVTMQALNALKEVVARYPNSDYARDAQLKVEMTRDHLAGKELDVGRFYQNEGQYLSAIGRFREVIEEYQTTSQTPEALHRLVESYLSIGLEEEAQQVASVLGYNYPQSKWYEYSYTLLTDKNLSPSSHKGGGEGWLGRLFGSIF
jgi:outer membrane protein assembly factor BamD